MQPPLVVLPGSGRVLRLIGVTHQLVSQQTGGGYYLFESEFEPEIGIMVFEQRSG